MGWLDWPDATALMHKMIFFSSFIYFTFNQPPHSMHHELKAQTEKYCTTFLVSVFFIAPEI